MVSYFVNMAFNVLTTALHSAPDQGMLLLGLGEASRSLVLLVGVTLALPERRKILSLIALAALPALLMATLGLLIEGAVADLLPRLFVGGLACLFCLAVAVGLLMPTAALFVLDRLRRTFRVKGELG
jgi:putative peptidoglycan lipid II flippase